jgi:phospholipid/cholesterol/gamma-HCH transport system substrate-binding protein
MQSRANYALIGLFTLATVAGLLGLALWFGSGTTETVNARLVFNSDVSGLGRGSSVLFNGLKVGEVTQLEIEPTNPRQINATIKINRSTPLRADTTARLEGQGLAGVVAVQLRGGSANAAPLISATGQPLPSIAAEPSEDILKRVGSIAKSMDAAIVQIEDAINRNAGPVSASIAEAERFTGGMAEDSQSLDKLMKGLGNAADFIGPLPDKIQTFSNGVLDSIRSLDPKRVVRMLDDADTFTADLAAQAPAFSAAMSRGASTTAKLNSAADGFGDTLAGAQNYLGGANGENGRKLLHDVSNYARYLRDLADSLDTRSAALTVDIVRATSDGSRKVNNFAGDAQIWLSRFIRSLHGWNENPQGLMTGKRDALPWYTGRR